MHSLGIEPTSLLLLAPRSAVYALKCHGEVFWNNVRSRSRQTVWRRRIGGHANNITNTQSNLLQKNIIWIEDKAIGVWIPKSTFPAVKGQQIREEWFLTMVDCSSSTEPNQQQYWPSLQCLPQIQLKHRQTNPDTTGCVSVGLRCPSVTPHSCS